MPLQIIEADGAETVPHVVTSLDTLPGQRYSVVVRMLHSRI